MKDKQDKSMVDLWRSIGAMDALQPKVAKVWAAQWAAVLSAPSVDALRKVVADALGEEAGPTLDSAEKKTPSLSAGPRSKGAGNEQEQQHVPEVLSLSEVYSFIDGDKVLHKSDHAADLGLETLGLARVQLLQRNVEAWLWRRYVTTTDSSTTHNKLYVNLDAKKDTVMIKEVTSDMRLPFAGVVTQTRGKESFELCTVFGVELFLTHGGADKISHECCIPAWCAKPVNRADQAVFRIDFEKVTVHVSADMSVASSESELPVDQKKISVDLTVPSLVLQDPDGEMVQRLTLGPSALKHDVDLPLPLPVSMSARARACPAV